MTAPRLAWHQLRHQRVRLGVAVAGVAFAVILMLMQMGFMDALFRSAVAFHRTLDAEIVLVHPHYTVLGSPTVFPRRRLYQALGLPGVAAVTGIYTALARWKNPWTGETRDAFLVGVDPAADALRIPGVTAARALLQLPDVVLFDRHSRPQFGPVAAALTEQPAPPLETEIAGRRVAVRGLFALGSAIGIEATVVTSDLNFHRILPGRDEAAVGIGLVRLAAGADPQAVRDALAAQLPSDVAAMTRDEFVARELTFWRTISPIGFVFTFGVGMGLVVGTIIVYQILFADIADHEREYATLKAMGYGHGYLAGTVGVEATILALAGALPGIAVSWWLYGVAASATSLPMTLGSVRVVHALGLTLAMCWLSGLIAMRRLRTADPAEII
jgi:putative ABC transport system permease protein